MQQIDYPLLLPPKDLAEKGAKNWNSKDAKNYLKWFNEIKENRIDILFAFLELEKEDSRHLSNITSTFHQKISFQLNLLTEFDETRQILVFNNQGYALVHDFGVYMGEQLKKLRDGLGWKIEKLPKSDPSYNLPVISGFKAARLYVDTIRLSVVNWTNIVNSNMNVDEFEKLYDFLKNK